MLRPVTHDFPRCWPASRYVGALLLRLQGWRVDGDPPPLRKAVVIAVPHTSNWDFWYALLACWELGMSFQWLGKDSLFQGILGRYLKWLGGVSVDRSNPNGLVAQVAERFRSEERLVLMVPAEGTRGQRPYWKSGFYWMASEAQVPVVLGYLDYPRRWAGFGPVVFPSGDVRADMDRVRAFYADKVGKHPELQSRIRLAAEDGPEGAPGGNAAG
jgi:1-acyl-sn-glycerol-3-phosphate acyltransferase